MSLKFLQNLLFSNFSGSSWKTFAGGVWRTSLSHRIAIPQCIAGTALVLPQRLLIANVAAETRGQIFIRSRRSRHTYFRRIKNTDSNLTLEETLL